MLKVSLTEYCSIFYTDWLRAPFFSIISIALFLVHIYNCDDLYFHMMHWSFSKKYYFNEKNQLKFSVLNFTHRDFSKPSKIYISPTVNFVVCFFHPLLLFLQTWKMQLDVLVTFLASCPPQMNQNDAASVNM